MTNQSDRKMRSSGGFRPAGDDRVSKFFMTYGAAIPSAIVAFLVYLPALHNDFVNWDDEQYVYDNPFIKSLDTRLVTWAFTTFRASNWHPLTWLSHAVDVALWGLAPMGHHLTNNVLHAADTFLVVLLTATLIAIARKTSGLPAPDKGALAVAGLTAGLLFGLHPLRVESVAWISERKDLLCAFFFVLSLLAYLKYAACMDEDEPLSARFFSRRYLLALFVFLLALLSKPMAVTLPVVLLIVDWYPLNRIHEGTAMTVIAEKVPFMVLSLISSVLTIKAQSAGKAVVPLEAIPAVTRVLVGIKALVLYLWKMIMPLSLSPFYPYPRKVDFLSPEYLLALGVVLSSIVLAIASAKKNRMWFTAWGYYLITLLPVLGFVQVGGQAMADRYSYLPSIAPTLLISIGVACLYKRISTLGVAIRAASVGVALVVVFSLSYITEKQIAVWKDSFALWNFVLKKDPRLALPHNNLALAYAREGQQGPAIEHLRRAIELNPQWAIPHYNLAKRYMDMGLNEKAINELIIAISLFPQFAEAHNNLGILYASQGLLNEAVEHFRAAVTLQPSNASFRHNLNLATGNR